MSSSREPRNANANTGEKEKVRKGVEGVVTRRLPVGMRAGSSEEKNNGQGQEHTSKTGMLGVREGAPPKKIVSRSMFHMLNMFIGYKLFSAFIFPVKIAL